MEKDTPAAHPEKRTQSAPVPSLGDDGGYGALGCLVFTMHVEPHAQKRHRAVRFAQHSRRRTPKTPRGTETPQLEPYIRSRAPKRGTITARFVCTMQFGPHTQKRHRNSAVYTLCLRSKYNSLSIIFVYFIDQASQASCLMKCARREIHKALRSAASSGIALRRLMITLQICVFQIGSAC